MLAGGGVGVPKYSEQSLSQGHFVYHKFHMN